MRTPSGAATARRSISACAPPARVAPPARGRHLRLPPGRGFVRRRRAGDPRPGPGDRRRPATRNSRPASASSSPPTPARVPRDGPPPPWRRFRHGSPPGSAAGSARGPPGPPGLRAGAPGARGLARPRGVSFRRLRQPPRRTTERETVAINARWIPKFTLNDIIRAAIGLALVFLFLAHEAEWKEMRFLQQLELWAYDTRLRLFLPKTRDTRVVIVDIDEKSLKAEGRFPWPRDKLATMIKQLFERYHVRVVGFDVAFPEADTSSGLPIFEVLAAGELKDNAQYQAFLKDARASLDYDQLFANEMAKWPVVLGVSLRGKEDIAGVLPARLRPEGARATSPTATTTPPAISGNIRLLQDAATATGHIYPALDVDGVTRRVPMFMRYKDAFYESLSLAITRTYLGNAPVRLVLDKPRKVRQHPRGMDAVHQDRPGGDPARPRDDRDGPLPRLRRLPVHLRHRRDPRHAPGRGPQGQDRHRGHLRRGARRPARDAGAGGPARRRGPRRARGGHARRHHQEPPARGAGHRGAGHLPGGHPARARAAAAVGGVVHGGGRRALRAGGRLEPLPVAVEELGGAGRLAAA